MNYIIGAGISGLVIAEIMRQKGEDYKILTNKIGGQMGNSFPLGPRILHKNKVTEEFLKSMDLYIEPKEFKVGYIIENMEIVDNVSEEYRRKYYLKTRGIDNVNYSCMSAGKNRIIGWDINELGLLEKLIDRNRDIIGIVNINSIDTVNKKLIINDKDDAIKLKYKNLISTIDLKILTYLVGKSVGNNESYNKYEFKKNNVYFTLVKKYNKLFEGIDYDYIYDITDRFITRITKVDNYNYVYESKIPLWYSDLNHLGDINNYEILESMSIESQLVTEHKVENLNGIELAGRYAQYDHSIKTNEIIERYWSD